MSAQHLTKDICLTREMLCGHCTTYITRDICPHNVRTISFLGFQLWQIKKKGGNTEKVICGGCFSPKLWRMLLKYDVKSKCYCSINKSWTLSNLIYYRLSINMKRPVIGMTLWFLMFGFPSTAASSGGGGKIMSSAASWTFFLNRDKSHDIKNIRGTDWWKIKFWSMNIYPRGYSLRFLCN